MGTEEQLFMVGIWNELPKEVVEAGTTATLEVGGIRAKCQQM